MVNVCGLPLSTRAAGWSASAVTSQSRWQERSDVGRRLVLESGLLAGLRVATIQSVGELEWSAAAQALAGDRRYTGFTNSGSAAESTANLREAQVALQTSLPIAAGWRGSVGLEASEMDRNIQSTATAQGYPEVWRWVELSVGVARRWYFADGALDMEVRGATMPWRRENVRLPGRDAVELTPGAGRSLSAALRWQQRLIVLTDDESWRYELQLGWTRTSWGASKPKALTRSGVLTGVVLQPASELRSVRAGLGLVKTW